MSAPIDLDVVRDLIADGQPLNAKVAERMAVELEQWRAGFGRLDEELREEDLDPVVERLLYGIRTLVPESS